METRAMITSVGLIFTSNDVEFDEFIIKKHWRWNDEM